MKQLAISFLLMVVTAIAAFNSGWNAGEGSAWDTAWSDGYQTAHRFETKHCQFVTEPSTGVNVKVLRDDGQIQTVFVSNCLSNKDELVVSHRMLDDGNEWGTWWWLPLSTLKRSEE